MKTLAVMITAYKAEQYILETLNSFKEQQIPTDWNIKYFIGVDACVDTANLLKKNNISYYSASENVGTYVLTNSLIKEALSHDVDAFLRFDSDDIPCEKFLVNGIRHLENAGVVQPYRIECDENLTQKSSSKIADGSVFFNLHALSLLGGYSHYRVACDGFFTRRAKKLNLTKQIESDLPTYLYRRVSGSLTKTQSTGDGSPYRKDVKSQMRKEFKSGKYKIDNPVTTILSYHKFNSY